jgi:hypothetical protein
MRFMTLDRAGKENGIDLTRIDDESGSTYWILCGSGETSAGVPVSNFMAVWIDEVGKCRMYSGEIRVRDEDKTAVLVPSPVTERGKKPKKEHCLLLVNARDGRLTQASYDEKEVDGEVVHQYHPIDTDFLDILPGIRVVTHADNQWLLELLPNAAFRLEDEQGTLSVRWTGFADRIDYKTQTKQVNSGLIIKEYGRSDRHGRAQTG